jgi:capsular polysaccharide biosynthesis protein/cellulose biosynthesis protein BcsQ
LAIAAAAAVSSTQQKVYRASTKIVVGQSGGIFQPQFGNVFQPFTQTMSSLFKSDIVATTVIRDFDLKETPKSLLAHVEVSSTPDSAVLQVSFDSHNRAYAVRTLGRMASAFTALVRQKLGGPQETTSKAGALPPITATVFDPAHASPKAVSPRPGRTLAFAGIIGLALGVVLGLLRDALDDRLRGRDEVEEHFAAPVVAALPKSMLRRPAVETKNRSVRSFLGTGDRHRRMHSEELDPLRLHISGHSSRGTVVVITSSAAGEGKSAVAANLGVALALAGENVICVDADPTQPRLSHYLGVQQVDGNSVNSRRGSFDLQEALRDVDIRNGAVQDANASPGEAQEQPPPNLGWSDKLRGRTPGRIQLLTWGNEQEARAHRSIADLAAELKVRTGYVVVDAPPLPAGTTFSLLSIADETIVVAREEKTTKDQARFVRQTLKRLRVPSYSIVSIGAK